jgi:hypothetical protein
MARPKSLFVALAIGSAFAAHPAYAQSGSTSLTHTVQVTVPARVRVTVSSATSTLDATRQSGATPALSVSVAATQSWALSANSAIVATGTSRESLSTVLIRSTSADSTRQGGKDPDEPVVLTIVAK